MKPSVTASLALLLFTSLLTVGSASQDSHPANKSLAALETTYADLTDAYYAVSTIGSGLFASFRGRDRRAWLEIYRARRKNLLDRLPELSDQPLSPSDARALSLMRHVLDSFSAEPAPSLSKRKGGCRNATQSGLSFSDLHKSLYSCFEEVGQHLRFEDATLSRLAVMDRLGKLKEPARRKALFLSLVPLWQAINAEDHADSPYRRLIAMTVAEATKEGSRIDAAARTLGVPPDQVETWLEQILDAWRSVSGNRSIEPWDYHYVYSEADRFLDPAIALESMIPASQRYYRDLGADLDRLGVLFDVTPRPGKAPIAYQDWVSPGRMIGGAWRPSVVRVSASYERGGLGLLNELVHEIGHAAHACAIHTRPAFMDQGDDLFVEAFADVPSWDTYEPAWQQKYLARSSSRRSSQLSLYSSVMLDVAWGLFELRMLRDPQSDPNIVWTEITNRYLHIVPHPELSWWAMRAQLVDLPGYMINYGLGAVLTADIRAHVQESIGPFDAGNPRWYPWLTEHLIRFGAERETSELLRGFLGRSVSPKALLENLRSLAPAADGQ